MNVLKFGGTSVGSAQRIQEVAKLISDDQPKIGRSFGHVRNDQHVSRHN